MENRKDKIKSGLNNDVYSSIEKLNKLSDNTKSSTSQLADILADYDTRVDNLDFTKEVEELEILDEADVEVEIDNDDLLQDYNDKVHGVGLNTLDDLLSSPTISYTDELTKYDDINDDIDTEDFTGEDEVNTRVLSETVNDDEVFTQNLKSPIMIDDFDIDEKEIDTPPVVNSKNGDKVKKEVKFKKEEKQVDSQKEKKFDIKDHYVDILLVLILIFLIIFLVKSYIGA